MTKQEAKILKVAKVKCMKTLDFFTRYFYKNLHKRKFRVLRHHRKMIEALDRVFSGKCRRLLISIPPRYGKTELAVKNFIAMGLALNPSAKFIHLSASDALAQDNSEGANDIVRCAEYRDMFPEVRIKQSTFSKKKWYTTAGGGVYARGAAAQVTGFGAGATSEGNQEQQEKEFEEWLDSVLADFEAKQKFGGALIIDDAIKPEDADSDTKRIRVNRRWNSTIKSRLNSRDTPVIVIMQRLHPMDLIGYLKVTEGLVQDGGEWEELVMPALFVNEKGELEALDPSKHTVEDLLKMENNPDEEVRIAYQRQYQQNPKPREGLLFPDSELKYYDPRNINLGKVFDYRFGYVDPADKGGDDICTIISYLVGDKIYIADVLYNKQGTDYNEPKTVELFLKHQLEAAEFESNGAWVLFGKAVRTKVLEKHPNCSIRLFSNTKNKHTRILAQSSFIRENFIFRADWYDLPEYRRFMENLTAYRQDQTGPNKNAHDDAPDSCAGTAKHFSTRFSHIWNKSEVANGKV